MPIGKSVIENEAYLKTLATANAREAEKLLKNSNTDQLLALVEVCLNVLHSRVPLSKTQKQKLYKNREFVRRLARVKSENGARKLVAQRGSGPVIAALLIPVLAELAQKLIAQI